MKRNMDLILKILRDLEIHCKPSTKARVSQFSIVYKLNPADYPECTEEELWEHCQLIVERKLAEINLQDRFGFSFTRLTWEGHDFVDNAQDESIWNAAKKVAGNMSFGIFKTVLEQLALKAALGSLGM